MKYSYNWLRELSQTKLVPKKIADLLMLRSFEVEGIEKRGEELKKVVVGKILEIKKHPNADKLSLVKITLGSKKLEIVCGASNIKIGNKVPVVLVGTRLPNGLEIKETEIRGVKSCGMLCAENELGLGSDHSGILILDENSKIGASLEEALNLKDTILNVDVLSNRGHDALSYIGLAREICALEGRKFTFKRKAVRLKASQKLKVTIQDKDLCSRYLGVVMENIEVKDSPFWLKAKLLSSGLRPINNIVDATNFVMLETGQPLHAFDYEVIKSKNSQAEIIVRRSKKGEEIKLLDETVIRLSQDDLLIANHQEALAIAGIMGGMKSGISVKTKTVVLESANFNPQAIRQTRLRLNLKTDASDRFEKEIDPNLASLAMDRLVEIIQKIAQGEVEGGKDLYPRKVQPWKIKLDINYVQRLLGETISEKEIIKILDLLEVKGQKSKVKTPTKNSKIIEFIIPTYRLDLKTSEDLIEEIGRLYGYEKIKIQPPKEILKPAKINAEKVFERKIKEVLSGLGFDEVYNYSFYGSREAQKAKVDQLKHWELENPMNPEQLLLRVSLLPNLLKNIRENLKHFKEFSLFEIGNVYRESRSVLPEEKKMLAGAVLLEKDSQAESFYFMKGLTEALFQKLKITDYFFAKPEKPAAFWHPNRTAEIKIKGFPESIGFLGEVNPFVLAAFEIKKRVVIFELAIDKLFSVAAKEKEFQSISKFPEVVRDISLLSHQGVQAESILKIIREAGGNLVREIELFDIFEKDGEISYAFHIIFGSSQRTLESREVDSLIEKINSELEEKLKVILRK